MRPAWLSISVWLWAVPRLVLGRPCVTLNTGHKALFALRGGGDGGNGGGNGQAFDIATLKADLDNPEALEEVQAILDDPEQMAQVRDMMDDPAFRSRMLEQLASSGQDVAAIRAKLAGNDVLTAGLASVGRSMGVGLEVLKGSAPDAEAFTSAANLLLSCCRNLRRSPEEQKYRRLRLTSSKLQERLLAHSGGRRCLEALGFTEASLEGDAEYLCLPAEGVGEVAMQQMLRRQEELILEQLEEVERAKSVTDQTGLPYSLTLELPHVRRICRENDELASQVTALIMQNKEFRSHVMGPMAEAALPSILQLLRSSEGLQGLLEYYAGALPPEGTRVQSVGSVTEWKEALASAGDRPVAALFSSSSDMGCRIIEPMFNRMSTAADFSDVEFVKVQLKPDDGLAMQIFDENGVAITSTPTFVFLLECLELRKWRFQGMDISKVAQRINRIITRDRLDDGPEDDVA